MKLLKLMGLAALVCGGGLVAHDAYAHSRVTYPIGRIVTYFTGQESVLLSDSGACYQNGYQTNGVWDPAVPYDVPVHFDIPGPKTIEVFGRANGDRLTCRAVVMSPSGGVTRTGDQTIAVGSPAGTKLTFSVWVSDKHNVFVECMLPPQCRAFWTGINYFEP